MKKIIRITEQDLAKLASRVINSSLDSKSKANNFILSIDKDEDGNYDEWDGTDENLMYDTIMSIKSKSEYFEITNIVKEKTGKHIPYWIDSELDDNSSCYDDEDGGQKIMMFCHIADLGVSNQSEWTKESCKKHWEDCEWSKNSD